MNIPERMAQVDAVVALITTLTNDPAIGREIAMFVFAGTLAIPKMATPAEVTALMLRITRMLDMPEHVMRPHAVREALEWEEFKRWQAKKRLD